MDSLKSINFVEEKRKQEYNIYKKINPKNRIAVQNMILKYDLSKTIISVIRENFDNYEKLKTELEKFLLEREIYLNSVTENL
jgi:hypothetical protein